MARVSEARLAALDALKRVRTRDAYVRDILPEVLDSHGLTGAERAFATKLAVGVVQTRGVLDAALDAAMSKPGDVSRSVRDALVISVYEMLFLDKQPYSAVDQGVELAAHVTKRVRGLANAVLHAVARNRDTFFNDKGLDAVSQRAGFPLWLTGYLTQQGSDASAYRFMECSNEAPCVFCAINALRAADEEVLNELDNHAIEYERIAFDGDSFEGCLRLARSDAIQIPPMRRLIHEGKLIISDFAAQLIAWKVAQTAPASLLEIGAGRGTKTSLIQNFAWRRGGAQVENLVCVDAFASKLSVLEQSTRERGVLVSKAIAADATNLMHHLEGASFDTVFIDAPCTGLGTLRRHPEIRWKITPSDIEAAATLDVALLEEGSRAVKPQGSLLYATCTITDEENEDAVNAFLHTDAGSRFHEESSFQTPLLSGGCDSHFLATLRRSDSQSSHLF